MKCEKDAKIEKPTIPCIRTNTTHNSVHTAIPQFTPQQKQPTIISPHALSSSASISTNQSASPRSTPNQSSPLSTPPTRGANQYARNVPLRNLKSGPGGRVDVLPDMPRRSYLTSGHLAQHVTHNNNTGNHNLNQAIGQSQSRPRLYGRKEQKQEGFKSILSKWEDRCNLLKAYKFF